MTMAAEAPAESPAEAAPTEAPPAAESGEQAVVETTVEGGEQPAAEPATPPAERETAIFRRSLKMREQGVEAQKKAEDVLSQVRHEREQLASERQQLRDLRKVHEAIEADPMAYFEHFSVDPADFARRMMNQSDPIRGELEKERRERIALQQEIQRERQERSDRDLQGKIGHAKQNFVRFVQDSDDYPDLADEDGEEIAEVFWELASEHHRNTGKVPTFEMVAAHLQQQADAKRARREQRRQQRGAPTRAANPGGGHTALQRPATNGHAATGPGPRAPSTLTNADSTTRTTLPRGNATEEEVNEWAAQELRKAFRKDADT